MCLTWSSKVQLQLRHSYDLGFEIIFPQDGWQHKCHNTRENGFVDCKCQMNVRYHGNPCSCAKSKGFFPNSYNFSESCILLRSIPASVFLCPLNQVFVLSQGLYLWTELYDPAVEVMPFPQFPPMVVWTCSSVGRMFWKLSLQCSSFWDGSLLQDQGTLPPKGIHDHSQWVSFQASEVLEKEACHMLGPFSMYLVFFLFLCHRSPYQRQTRRGFGFLASKAVS